MRTIKRKEVGEMNLEVYIIEKLEARIHSLERKLEELSGRQEKTEERFCRIDDDYVDGVWLEKVLAKLHPETKEDSAWYDDI